MTTKIPTQAEYEAREARQHFAKMQEIERSPLRDRQEARSAFLNAMVECPTIIGERVAWLIEGCYGFGACQAAKRILEGTVRNKVACLGQLIAALEWQCPAGFAAGAWKSLTKTQRERVNRGIERAIKSAESAI